EEFFDLEKRHRGKDIGLFALNFILMRAAQVGNPDMPLVKGRDRALVILREHYLTHEDLDITMTSLRWGPILFGGEEFLKAASETSPQEHVRASALYHWAELLKFKADFVTMRRGIPGKPSKSAADRDFEEKERRTMARLKSFDEKKARKQ